MPERVEVRIEPGGRVLVVSNLGLRKRSTDESVALTTELAQVLESQQAPCTLVLAGNTFDLAADQLTDPSPALAAHVRLCDAIASLGARPDGRVILCPGDRDDVLARQQKAAAVIDKNLGGTVAQSVDLEIATGSGPTRVRVDPGVTSPPPPSETDDPPAEIDDADWLAGVDLLTENTDVASFVAARLFYRRVLRRFAWSFVPLAVGFVLFAIGEGMRLFSAEHLARATDAWAAAISFGGIILIAAATVLTVVRWWMLGKRMRVLDGDEPDLSVGDRIRIDPALEDPIEEGFTGVVVGGAADAALTGYGSFFVARAGQWGPVATRRPGRLGAPDAWVVEQRWSWLELEAGADLHARLHLARRQPPSTTLFERILSRREPSGDADAAVVASWPEGPDWPTVRSPGQPSRRARRIGAVLIAFAGLVNLVSAVLPPVRIRLDAVSDVMPLALSEAAAMVVALSGILLLLLARGIRRGQRHAWMIAEVVLVSSFLLHIVKGLDFEEALLTAAIALFLAANRRHFRVRSDDVSVTRGLAVLAGGAVVAVVSAVVAIKAVPGHHHRDLSWYRAFEAAGQRLVGITTIPVSARTDQFLVPVLVTVTVGLVCYAGWLFFGPVVAKRLSDPDPADALRARAIVTGSQGGTLAYFALRDDKRWFFAQNTVVAYAVTQGVALVSPDPIGPATEREMAWQAFRRFADDHGWPVAVMGASQDWLPIFRRSGMREMYIGDEAVVDVRRFTLEGGRNKALRQAVNRIAKNGYTIEFRDPADLEPELESGLRDLMTESRRGEMERGFSMTLGRIFDPRDTGLLLAVCHGPDGRPAAFCQYVPAPGIDGYSLDLMRRSEDPAHPNGLTDFVVVETIRHLREAGRVGLGLNFATMRAVLAGERGDGTSRRVERWFYGKMSDSMQIESLWRYNAKFDPQWVPRYACYESTEHLLSSAAALAKAESWWEIPVVGRFFRPARETVGDGRAPERGSAEDAEPFVEA